MQVICKDGTSIQCADFEAVDSGVLFYQESPQAEEADDDEESEQRATGFVPITELRFVLPDELARGAAQPAPTPQRGAGQPPTGAPPTGQQSQAGQPTQGGQPQSHRTQGGQQPFGSGSR